MTSFNIYPPSKSGVEAVMELICRYTWLIGKFSRRANAIDYDCKNKVIPAVIEAIRRYTPNQ